jgi:hypothetical protein
MTKKGSEKKNADGTMDIFELPSGVEVELREMTGAEEEILTNPRLVRSGEAVNLVLANCTLRLGEKENPTKEDLLDLLAGDRLFILVKLREMSLGREVEVELVCGNATCRERNATTVDLGELEVSGYGPEREMTFTLPGSKQVVRFTHLDGHRETRLAKLKEATLSSAMLMRILDVDGQPPTKKLLADMSLRDRTALREEMFRVDAGIDTTVEVECAGCGATLRTRVEQEPGFLFPSARF